MKNYILVILLVFAFSCANVEREKGFDISENIDHLTIYIDKNADYLTRWAAEELSEDIEALTGKKLSVEPVSRYSESNHGIYIGAVENELIQSVPNAKLDQLSDEWESHLIRASEQSLFIVGSDVRGTAYGVFALSRELGVSPWKWWADVVPQKRDELIVPASIMDEIHGPSVKFRGIFINDEDWGLQPWAAKTFEPEVGDLGPKSYEKVFQLLLRLKANTIWPAMHPSTKAFFTIPGNREMAEKYQIVVGTSHAEPMLRNNVDEWNKKEMGEYNYFTNKETVSNYWQERVNEAVDGSYIFTMGMRGIHDSGMQGNFSKEEKTKMLEQIIADQRQMLAETIGKDIEVIPQAFIPYKEVLDLYNNGLKLPDDITLMWTDDNYGYIRRMSDEQEQQRSGGGGVYYHLSYWGRPHDYLWLSSTQPGLVWFEMTRAYQNGANKIWIANVGDIKPAEYNIQFFMDLAWDVEHTSADMIIEHSKEWHTRIFGETIGEDLAAVMQEYYRLAFLRKPEFMGWSQTEPTTKTRLSEFSDEEADRRIEAYYELWRKVDHLKDNVSDENLDAYFQLIEYPVKAAASMNFKFLYAQKAALSSDSAEAEEYQKLTVKSYNKIIDLTAIYNHEIAEGKWNEIMTMNPRNLPVYQLPNFESDLKKEGTESTPIFIQANSLINSIGISGYEWKNIEGLGYSDAAVTLFPFKNREFTEEAPYLEYQFDIEELGKYELEVRCLPTHSNEYNQQTWVSANGQISDTVNLNTRGRSEQWKINVLRNAAIARFPIQIDKVGKQKIRIYINQSGIVLDQLAIKKERTSSFYEIPR